MSDFIYQNGKIISSKKAKIDVNDLGFVRGYGVFDVFKTVNGFPFLLKEHFKRLEKSAKFLDIQLPFNLGKFNEIVNKLLQKNRIISNKGVMRGKDVFIKTIVTGGVSSNGLVMDGSPTVVIFCGDLEKVVPKKQLFKKGAKIITLEFQRFLPEAKTLNYIMAVKNQNKKIRAQATEIVYHYQGKLLEGATSNIFLVKNGRIITPKENILSGVTRDFMLNLLKKTKLKVKVRKVFFRELKEADEVFLTGTFKDILPVIKVDNSKVGQGKVGKITKECQKLFQKSLNVFK